MKPIIRNTQQGRTVALVGDVYRFLATGEDTNGKYALIEALVGPGGGPPPHVHSREEEGFYILEGEITFTINRRAGRGDGGDVRQHAGRHAAQLQERNQQAGEDVGLGGAGRPGEDVLRVRRAAT